ncbi:MAG: hypothetical protein KY397_00875 [Gemmatimonadetes bacterium]|nr:hypothetical protein [Gemmatimonadota bacterium]
MPEVQPHPLPQDLLTPTRGRPDDRTRIPSRPAGLLEATLVASLLAGATGGVPGALAQATAPSGPIEVVLDASGSMRSRMGDVDRMAVAREFVHALQAALAEESEEAPRLALRAYGSASHRLRRDCTDTRLLAELGADSAAFADAVSRLQPLGVSPLAYALERAAADTATTYVLVTDGGDNCGGAPCATWRRVVGRAGDNRRLRLHVVAIEPEPDDIERLRCLSRAGSGSFTRVESLAGAVPAARRLALVLRNQGRIEVRLTIGGGESFSAPVRLTRPLTGELVAAFPGRRARTVPAGLYTVTLQTAPPIRIERVMVLPGQTVTIERSEFGRLIVDLPEGADGRAPVSIRSADDRAEVRYVRTGDSTILVAGAYDVEVDLGDSLVVREDLRIATGRTTRLVAGGSEPGSLLVSAPGFPDPPPVRVLAYRGGVVDTLAVGRSAPLPPGSYRLVVQTLPPYVTEDVVVDPAGETTVTLPETGILGIDLFAAGGPLRGVRVEVQESTTGEDYGTIPSGERRLVMPGTYRLGVATAPPITVEDVTVRPGEVRVVEQRGLSRIEVSPSVPAGTPPLRLEILSGPGGRRLAESTGPRPWVAARPGEYLARVWRAGSLVWEGGVVVASEKSARIDWAEL